MTSKLVITGCNALTPYGFGLGALAEGLRTGPAAAAPLESAYAEGPAVARVPAYDARALLGTRAIGNFDRLTLHVGVAVKQLLDGMGLASTDTRGSLPADDRISLTLGSSGPLQSIVAFDLQAIEEPTYVQPGVYPNVVLNVPASYAAIRHAIRGSCITLTDGETSSLQAFATAAAQIESGRIDFAIVGGAEEATPAYQLLRSALARQQGTETGVLVEGAALMCLEPADQAQRQGRASLARVYGCTHAFAPGDQAAGIGQCLANLRRRFGKVLDEVGVVSAEASVPAGAWFDGVRTLALAPRIGDAGAMHGALAVLQVLADHGVPPGETVLVLQCSPEGACAALLLQKHAHAA